MKKTARPVGQVLHRKQGFSEVHARCPHCGNGIQFVSRGEVSCQGKTTDGHPMHSVTVGFCPVCQGISIAECFAMDGIGKTSRLVWPVETWPDSAPEDIEPDIRKSYNEARNVLSLSPAAAAVLARRCVQQIIRGKLGITKKRLVDEIAEALRDKRLTSPVSAALDHVREIGNIGAHPDFDDALTLVEVSDDEAAYTLEVVERLFEDLYVTPARTAAMKARLDKK